LIAVEVRMPTGIILGAIGEEQFNIQQADFLNILVEMSYGLH